MLFLSGKMQENKNRNEEAMTSFAKEIKKRLRNGLKRN